MIALRDLMKSLNWGALVAVFLMGLVVLLGDISREIK